MARIIRIVTSSLGILEHVSPPYNIRIPDSGLNLEVAASILDASIAYQPDLVLLPETFKTAGRSGETSWEDAEEINGSAFSLLAAYAAKGHYNLVAGLLMKEDGFLSNDALVFDRKGSFVGKYSKNYPVESEIRNGIRPGTDVPFFDLDFGRIGAAICFDLNWLEIWQKFSEMNIDLACWISAYEGGYPLIRNAQYFKYPIVSSVYPYHAKIIDITGEILNKTSRWNRIAYYALNLDREIYHTDKQMDKILAVQKKFGADVDLKAYTEEHLFMITNNRQDCSIKNIEQEFNLVSYKDYISACTDFRNKNI